MLLKLVAKPGVFVYWLLSIVSALPTDVVILPGSVRIDSEYSSDHVCRVVYKSWVQEIEMVFGEGTAPIESSDARQIQGKEEALVGCLDTRPMNSLPPDETRGRGAIIMGCPKNMAIEIYEAKTWETDYDTKARCITLEEKKAKEKDAADITANRCLAQSGSSCCVVTLKPVQQHQTVMAYLSTPGRGDTPLSEYLSLTELAPNSGPVLKQEHVGSLVVRKPRINRAYRACAKMPSGSANAYLNVVSIKSF